MKKFTYITAFLIGLTFVSCVKQEILPTGNNNSSDAPVWRSADGAAVGARGGDSNGFSITDPDDKEGSGNVVGGVLVDYDGNAITDPSDKDGSSKGNRRGK